MLKKGMFLFILLLMFGALVSALPSIIINSPTSGFTLDRAPLLDISAAGADSIWYSLDNGANITVGVYKDSVSQNISLIANGGFETTVTENCSVVPLHWQFYESTTPIDWNSNSYALTSDTLFGYNALEFTYDGDDYNDYLLYSMFVETGKKNFDVEFYAKPNMTFNSGNSIYGYCLAFYSSVDDEMGGFSDELYMCFNNTDAWSFDEWTTESITEYSRINAGDGWFKINFTTPQISEDATHIDIVLMPAYDDGTYSGIVLMDEISVLLDYGTHTIDVWANDSEGTTHMSQTFTISTSISSEIALVEPENNSVVANGTTIKVNATSDSVIETCLVSVGGGVNETMGNVQGNVFEHVLYFGSDGEYAVEVYCNDTDGDWGFEEYSFAADVTAPVVQLLSPENKTYYENPISLNYTVSEENAICAYSLNSAENAALLGNTTITAIDGANHISISCVDNAGNTGNATKTFEFDTKLFIHIDNLSSGAVVKIDGINYSAGETANTTRGSIVAIETIFNSHSYVDEILLDESMNLTVNATFIAGGGDRIDFDILSSYTKDMIYIVETGISSNSTIVFGTSAPLSEVELTGLHIRSGGAVYIGEYFNGGYTGIIGNIVILGTLEIISGLSPDFNVIDSPDGSSAVFGRIGDYPTDTNVYANFVKVNDVLFKNTFYEGYYMQELELSGVKNTDAFKIRTLNDKIQLTILSLKIKNATVDIDCKSECRINKRGPLDDLAVAGNNEFWYKAKNPEAHDFSFVWDIDPMENIVNLTDTNYYEELEFLTPENNAFLMYDDSSIGSVQMLFGLNAPGDVYVSSIGKPSNLYLLGPYIQVSELLVDDDGNGDTKINFHSPEYPEGFGDVLSGYANSSDSYYSENLVIKIDEGHLGASNPGVGNDIYFNIHEGQDVIFLSGTDNFVFENDYTSRWFRSSSDNAHLIVENITINLVGVFDYPLKERFTNPNISISSFDFELSGTSLDLNIKSDYANDSAYVLLRNLKDNDFEKYYMDDVSGAWEKTFSLIENEIYQIITVAVQNDGMQGKAVERIIPVESVPPEIIILEPTDVVTINSSTFAVSFLAIDNMAEEIECELLIDNLVINTTKITNGTTNTLSASGITEGVHDYNIACEDQSGNKVMTSSTYNQLTVDYTPPETVIVNSPESNDRQRSMVLVNVSASDTLSGIASVRINVTDSYGNSTVETLAASGEYYTGTYDSLELADGVHTIRVAAKDNAGNTDDSVSVNITADNTAPEINILADDDSVVVGDKIRFTVTINTSDANESTLYLKIEKDSSFVKSLDLEVTDTVGIYTATFNTNSISAGTYDAIASVYDNIGNIGKDVVVVTISAVDDGSGETDSGGSFSSSSTIEEPDDGPEADTPDVSNIIPPEDTSNTTDTNNTLETTNSTIDPAVKNPNNSITGRMFAFISTGAVYTAWLFVFGFAVVAGRRVWNIIAVKRNSRGITNHVRMGHLENIKKIVNRRKPRK